MSIIQPEAGEIQDSQHGDPYNSMSASINPSLLHRQPAPATTPSVASMPAAATMQASSQFIDPNPNLTLQEALAVAQSNQSSSLVLPASGIVVSAAVELVPSFLADMVQSGDFVDLIYLHPRNLPLLPKSKPSEADWEKLMKSLSPLNSYTLWLEAWNVFISLMALSRLNKVISFIEPLLSTQFVSLMLIFTCMILIFMSSHIFVILRYFTQYDWDRQLGKLIFRVEFSNPLRQ